MPSLAAPILNRVKKQNNNITNNNNNKNKKIRNNNHTNKQQVNYKNNNNSNWTMHTKERNHVLTRSSNTMQSKCDLQPKSTITIYEYLKLIFRTFLRCIFNVVVFLTYLSSLSDQQKLSRLHWYTNYIFHA